MSHSRMQNQFNLPFPLLHFFVIRSDNIQQIEYAFLVYPLPICLILGCWGDSFTPPLTFDLSFTCIWTSSHCVSNPLKCHHFLLQPHHYKVWVSWKLHPHHELNTLFIYTPIPKPISLDSFKISDKTEFLGPWDQVFLDSLKIKQCYKDLNTYILYFLTHM